MKAKLLLGIFLLAPITSYATPIVGLLSIRGTVTLNNDNPALATEVISWDSVADNRSGGTGTFRAHGGVGIAPSNLPAPWIFDPSTPTMPFLQSNGFTFGVEGISSINRIDQPFFKGISFSLIGDVTYPGLETTPLSTFVLSVNRDLSPAHFQKNVHFQLYIFNPIIPDSGSTLGLSFIAVSGVFGLRRFGPLRLA